MNQTPLPTGFARIDNLLDGGLPRGRVTLLTSQFTSMGKTSLAISIAYYTAFYTTNTLTYLTLEGNNEDIVYKFLAMDAGLDAWNIRQGKITEAEHARVKAAREKIKRGRVFINDYMHKSTKDIRRDFEENHSDLVVIDYLDLLRDTNLHYLQVLTDLQHLAEEWGVAFLVVTQMHSSWRPLFPEGKPGVLLLLSRQEEEAQLTVVRRNEIAQSLLHFHPTTTRFFSSQAECIEAYSNEE